MPHVIVKLWPGKSEDQKKLLAETIANDVSRILEMDIKNVSVGIEEINNQSWKDDVYKPDIIDKPECIYVKPGYSYK